MLLFINWKDMRVVIFRFHMIRMITDLWANMYMKMKKEMIATHLKSN